MCWHHAPSRLRRTTSASRAPVRSLLRPKSAVDSAFMSPPLAALTNLSDFPVSCNPCPDCANELVAAESNNASSSLLFIRRSFHLLTRRAHFLDTLDIGGGNTALIQQSTPWGKQSAFWSLEVGGGSGRFGGGGESPEVTRSPLLR
eukprot:scaffold52713_cov51-Cyclotella_meneghiniana.AAC.1